MTTGEDSDEEWARIADAVGEFEAQYIAARNFTPSVGTTTPPRLHAARQATGGGPGQSLADRDADPFALALRERDAAIEQLKRERSGEVANYRNRIRVLQNQVSGSGNVASGGRVEQLEGEKGRLMRELEEVRREVVVARERLAYAEFELGEAKDRERKYLKGGNAEGSEVKGNGNEAKEGDEGVGEGDVVEGTQLVGGRGSFDVWGSGVRRPVKRKKRRISSAGGRLERGKEKGNGVKIGGEVKEEMEGEKVVCVQEKDRKEKVEKTEGKKKQGGDEGDGHGVQHGWGVNLADGEWESGMLRRVVFGGGIGRRLLEMAGRMKEGELRGGILEAMGKEGGWKRLVKVVGKLLICGGYRGGRLVGLECIWNVGVYCEEVRRWLVDGKENGGWEVLESVKKVLESVSKEGDEEVVVWCMKVLGVGGCGIGEVGGAECWKARRVICCDEVLEWVGREGEVGKVAGELVETMSGVGMEDWGSVAGEGEEEEWRGEEWGWVERGWRRVFERGGEVGIVGGIVVGGVLGGEVDSMGECGGDVTAGLYLGEWIGEGVLVGCLNGGGIGGGGRRVLMGIVGGREGAGEVIGAIEKCERGEEEG